MGHNELTTTLKEKVGIIKPGQNPFNNPVWPIKSNGTWPMTTDCKELNSYSLHPHLIVRKTLTRRTCVLDLFNALFSIPLGLESQDQFAFMWNGRPCPFSGLPQGYIHSPTACQGMVARGLEKCMLLKKMVLCHCIDVMLTCD